MKYQAPNTCADEGNNEMCIRDRFKVALMVKKYLSANPAKY